MRILIRGAGDLATGIAYRLHKSGFEVIMTETEVPLTIRRTVAFSRAVYEGKAQVEDTVAELINGPDRIDEVLGRGNMPVIVDPELKYLKEYRADVIVDAILAKKNLGTTIHDAEFVIGVGPGFTVGEDCHVVVETKRGHMLGRVIHEGSAIPNTGVPGEIGGYSVERIIRAVADGIYEPTAQIGERVEKDDIVAYSGGKPVHALIGGVVRGMLQPGVCVKTGMKCGDIDARCEVEYCYTISDKARAIGGGVLEAIMEHLTKIKSLHF